MKKRILSLLLCALMFCGLLPVSVQAAGNTKSIMLATKALGVNVNSPDAATVYFGKDETGNVATWRVIGHNFEGIGSTTYRMTLLAADNMGDSRFSHHDYATGFDTNLYKESRLKEKMDALYHQLPEREKDYVIFTNLSSGEYKGEDTNGIAGPAVWDAYFWPLSTAQAVQVNKDLRALAPDKPKDEKYYWWLRSPGKANQHVAAVSPDGTVQPSNYLLDCGSWGVRPAFYLDSTRVIFTSAPKGGKVSGPVGADALTKINEYTGNEWKMTLLHPEIGIEISETDVTVLPGSTVTLNYDFPYGIRDTQYISVILTDEQETPLYYGNLLEPTSRKGTVDINLPADLAEGEYKLNIFGEIVNGDSESDYAGYLQGVSLHIVSKMPEPTPTAVFTATSDSTGVLSNVKAGMMYSTDGGADWNVIAGESMEITGVTAANDIKVYQPGDGTTTGDSYIQTIDVTQASKPENVTGVDCATTAQNDGKITGVDSTMEYKLSNGSDWLSITGNEVTGLTNETYQVRVKASGAILASESISVEIAEHVCKPTGEWMYDENNHWQNCSCDVVLNKAAHSGGKASYFKQAVCEICQNEYGTLPIDEVVPTGEISVSENKWDSFLNKITFGLFFKETQEVKITAEDDSYTHDGYTADNKVKIEYYLYTGEKKLR